MALVKQGVIRGPEGHPYVGWSVVVEEKNGAFFIYLIKDPSDPSSEGYDQWAADRDSLQRQLSAWTVE